MGLGGHPTSTDGFILGPSHGTVGRLLLFLTAGRFATLLTDCAPYLLNLLCNKILLLRI